MVNQNKENKVTKISRDNNFDLLRLFAALQVVIYHGLFHLELGRFSNLSGFIDYFPGVLMFFTISGFLIFSSYSRNKNLKQYIVNRVLRIYPGLWLCFLITLILLLGFNVINFSQLFSFTMAKWTIAQLTFFQFWTPDLLRSWGVHTPNGSLWTIPVEVQFYVFLPFIIVCFKRLRLVYKFAFFIIISILFNNYLISMMGKNMSELINLSKNSLLPYLYCFLTGSLIYQYWNFLKRFIEGKALFWLILFFAFCLATDTKPAYYPIGLLQLVSNLILSILTISLAFTLPDFGKILKGNDISYGVYIYHMLVINSLLSLGYVGKFQFLLVTIFITVIISTISWMLVERKALLLKNRITQTTLSRPISKKA